VMLLDMLTADAAHKHGPHRHHGHDFSSPPPRRSSSPAANGSFLVQMPLSIIGSVLRRQTPSPPSAPHAPESPPQPHHSPMTPASPPHSRPPSTTASSVASADGRPRKRPRPKTIFNLAQPPPTAHPMHMLHIRPKILLQLHQVIHARRPKPVYEVIPFSLLAPRSTRRLARNFNSRDRLGPHDLLIVKAEDYGIHHDDDKSDDERWGTREVVGVIVPGREDKGAVFNTELLFEDGSAWEATSMQNGGYEFNCTDEHGLALKSRWVPKNHTRRVSTMSSTSLSTITPSDDKKFTFSTITSNSRRHPIIATMTRTSISVLDSYTIPAATSPSTPVRSSTVSAPTAAPSSVPDMQSFVDNASERLPVKTDDALRRFIIVSGIWVAFSESWSQAYSSSKLACTAPLCSPGTFRPTPPGRAVSMSFIDSPRSISPASTIDENRRSLPRIFRSSTQKLQRNSTFSGSVSSPTSTKSSPASSPPLGTRARRSNSLGSEIRSRTGSTRKRFGLALQDQTLPETEEERQGKRSVELLHVKELSFPSPTESAASPKPAPIQIVQPPTPTENLPPSPSPASPTPRAIKAQSAYNPITTTGLWDSGVVDGPGIKKRPTSMVIVNQKMEKAKRKEQRSK
ncbi:hypothetical protein BS50DRAFT_444500, partial [Corynespora cassiicola Philippines]